MRRLLLKHIHTMLKQLCQGRDTQDAAVSLGAGHTHTGHSTRAPTCRPGLRPPAAAGPQPTALAGSKPSLHPVMLAPFAKKRRERQGIKRRCDYCPLT